MADRRDPGFAAAQELVDITDENGRVIGVAPRHEMRLQRLPHRSTFVIQILAEPEDRADFTLDRPYEVDQVEAWFENVPWASEPTFYDGPGPNVGQLLPVASDTLVVVHRRADWKDVNPGYWDLAFGGVCGAGEGWLPSARRELEEEAGLFGVPIIPAAAGRYSDDHGTEFAGIFVAPSAQKPVPNDGEVVAVDYVSVGELARWCQARAVCGDSKALVLPVLNRLQADE